MHEGYATLTACCEARVSTTPAPLTAREVIAVDIPATRTTTADTYVTTAIIACRAVETIAMPVPALPPARSGEKLRCCRVAGLVICVLLFIVKYEVIVICVLLVRLLHARLGLQQICRGRCHTVRRPEETTCALGRLRDRVPALLTMHEGYATLTACCEARVSTTPAPLTAREVIAVDIPATRTTPADTYVTTAIIACRAVETVAMPVPALPPA